MKRDACCYIYSLAHEVNFPIKLIKNSIIMTKTFTNSPRADIIRNRRNRTQEKLLCFMEDY